MNKNDKYGNTLKFINPIDNHMNFTLDDDGDLEVEIITTFESLNFYLDPSDVSLLLEWIKEKVKQVEQ